MTTDITVRKETEAIFKEACNELSIHYEVVRELEDGSVYRVTTMYQSEQYHLGISVGMKVTSSILNKL